MAEPIQLVIDASVAIKWVLKDEEHAAVAGTVLSDFDASQAELIAPRVFHYEVGHGLLRATRRGRIAPDEARRGLALVGNLGIVLVDEMLDAAFALSSRFGSSFYDGAYLALSATSGLRLLSADAKLRTALAGRFPLFLWIEDYPAAVRPANL